MQTKRTTEPERYAPMLDWWLAILVGLLIIVLLASIPYLMFSDVGVYAKIVASVAMMLTVLYIIDLTFFSNYYLTPDGLVVISQLRRHHFPYEHMKELRPGGFFGLITVPGKKRFALSTNCLVISMSDGQWKKITVSPKARDRFLDSLISRTNGLRSGNGKS